jgi:hypothetical protein
MAAGKSQLGTSDRAGALGTGVLGAAVTFGCARRTVAKDGDDGKGLGAWKVGSLPSSVPDQSCVDDSELATSAGAGTTRPQVSEKAPPSGS